MDIYVYSKEFFKESSEVKSALISAAVTLYDRIACYERAAVSFGRIFNDDKVKYDKHGDFYTFKFQRNNMQLRMLYTYMVVEGRPVIVIADFFVKKKNNKSYIKRFEAARYWDVDSIYCNSRCVANF